MAYSETIMRLVGVTMEDENGATVVCLEVVTSGNVRKIVRVPHFTADRVRAGIEFKLSAMEPEDRKLSWKLSMEHVKGWLRR